MVTSRMVGRPRNRAASWVYIATSITITDTAMLKVNIRSSTKAGSGSTIIDRMRTMRSGPASWRMLPGRRGRRLRLPFMVPMVAHQGGPGKGRKNGESGGNSWSRDAGVPSIERHRLRAQPAAPQASAQPRAATWPRGGTAAPDGR